MKMAQGRGERITGVEPALLGGSDSIEMLLSGGGSHAAGMISFGLSKCRVDQANSCFEFRI
jgi:hypothetical protein